MLTDGRKDTGQTLWDYLGQDNLKYCEETQKRGPIAVPDADSESRIRNRGSDAKTKTGTQFEHHVVDW